MDEAYYKQQFFTESRELLDTVSDALLTLEASPSPGEPLNAIFRSIHTIKGSAGVFALNELSGFAHHMENVLNKACEGKVPVTPELVDMLFQAVDALNAMLDAGQHGDAFPDYHELADAFREVTETKTEEMAEASKVETSTPSTSPDTKSEATGRRVETSPSSEKGMSISAQAMPDGFRAIFRAKAAQGYTPYLVRLHFTDDMLENGYDPLVLLKNLREVSVSWYVDTSHSRFPKPEEYDPLRLYLDVMVLLSSSRSEAELKDLAFDEDLIEVKALSVDGEVSDAVDTQCLKDFLETDTFLVEQIESTALQFEKTRDIETLNALFRSVHTLKGDASYVGLKRLGEFAHEMEALLDKLRTNPSLCTQETLDTILHGIDRLKGALEKLSRGEVDLDLGTIVPLESEAPEVPGKRDKPVLPPEVSKVFIFQLVQHKKVLETLCGVDLPQDPEIAERVRRVAKGLTSAAVFVGLNELMVRVADLRKALDDGQSEPYGKAYNALLGWIDEMTGEPRRLGEILLDTGKVTAKDLQCALEQQKPLGEILVEEGKLDRGLLNEALKKQTLMREASKMQEENRQQPADTPPAQGAATEIRVMRVDEEKIDTLSNMIGELVVAKNAYDYLLTRLLVDHELPQAVIKSFKDNLYLFSRLTSELQQGLLSVRMIPIRGVFHKYSRVVRDIARKQDKLIDFVTEGEETEIDKKVADTLSEPLIHMIRNACDHGVETPAERRAAGKPEKGTVRLRAYQEGSRLYVQVMDDGKGMDRIKVFEKALERGLSVISPDDERLLDVIFEPGFSMKDEVTDISGRGVGMDAVRSSVMSLGGSVSFRSVYGKGSIFTLELPMTMGISSALVVVAEGRQYAIPLDRVVETIRMTPERIRTFHDHKGVHYRGEVLPVERLDTLLYQIEHSGDPRELFRDRGLFALYDPAEEIDIVVLSTPRGKYGIVVDGFTRNVDIAIRPVPDVLKDIAVLSGVSILGDGKVLLVLNPDHLV